MCGCNNLCLRWKNRRPRKDSYAEGRYCSTCEVYVKGFLGKMRCPCCNTTFRSVPARYQSEAKRL